MGHVIFIVLHLIALLFLPVALFVTIAAHVIYAATRKRDPIGTGRYVKCPDCKEGVDLEASVCKHCGCKLVPASDQPRQTLYERFVDGRPLVGVKRPD